MTKNINQASVNQQESQDTLTKIKAISLHQPWASLIELGVKQFETRGWSTNSRGKLVICAAKKNSKQQQSQYETFASTVGIELTLPPWENLPFGMAISVVDLSDCIEMTDEFISSQSPHEIACGQWEPGRFAWKLENVQPLSKPVHIKGQQGLWNIPFEQFEQWLPRNGDGDAIIPFVVNGNHIEGITETDELTHDEQRDLLHLERKVERAFYEAGKALQELRDRRLYRSTHANFESYCLERFGFKRRHPYRLIDAAQVFDNLIEMCPNWTQILPTTEYQIRPMTCLEREQQVEAWTQAVAEAGGKVPSHRIVKNIVSQIRERRPVPNPWRVGEVATIIVKDNPDLRGKGGCWAVITEVHNFSCTVRLWDGNYQVKPENLEGVTLF
jgi:hypothetical protein